MSDQAAWALKEAVSIIGEEVWLCKDGAPRLIYLGWPGAVSSEKMEHLRRSTCASSVSAMAASGRPRDAPHLVLELKYVE